MNQSRIEQTIEEIYAFIEECKSSKLYPNKVVVAKDELYDMLDALRLSAPEEIKRYKKIITNRDAILNEAYAKSEEILNNAQTQNAQLLDQNEIVQAAYERANELMRDANAQAEHMVREANEDAERIRNASLIYTNDLLTNAEKMIQKGLDDMSSKYLIMESSMQNLLQIIKKNKEELVPKESSLEAQEMPEEVPENMETAAEESTASGEETL